MGEIHELFVLALSLVWFAGATPDSWSQNPLEATPRFRVPNFVSGGSPGRTVASKIIYVRPGGDPENTCKGENPNVNS